jgi:hypothetical protein
MAKKGQLFYSLLLATLLHSLSHPAYPWCSYFFQKNAYEAQSMCQPLSPKPDNIVGFEKSNSVLSFQCTNIKGFVSQVEAKVRLDLRALGSVFLERK